jgi:hypothetical protein
MTPMIWLNEHRAQVSELSIRRHGALMNDLFSVPGCNLNSFD